MATIGMPALDGATAWLNSEPLGPTELRGRVVLVNFWTLTCINWLRTVPHIRAWSTLYRDAGLVTLGVHTPEFAFEHDVDLVRQATQAREIDYPVVVDNDYAIWNAFDNHYWPALYFVDRDGSVRGHHFGEGGYGKVERVLERLLDVDRRTQSVEGSGIEADADWRHLRSPETYLGYNRSENFASQNGSAYHGHGTYQVPALLPINNWALRGEWTIGGEYVGLDRGPGSVAFRFHARDAHLVLSTQTRDPMPFKVLLDGARPGSAHGVDVDADGNGVLNEGRLYQLVRTSGSVREQTIEITFAKPGAQAYVFTFG